MSISGTGSDSNRLTGGQESFQTGLFSDCEPGLNCHDRNIIGNSPALKGVLEQIETVAPTDATVLLCGETGTGKEILARAIHERSLRGSHRFVKVNCAAIPSGLLESELFGHDKGAFTGALTQRIGRFELANQGTLLMDEIGDIPLELQPKLLRVLQEREFERLGSSRTIHSDVRIVAATHRDLAEMVRRGAFRADLYYRLNVFPIFVPPLRERREDIPVLSRHFVSVFAKRMNKQINVVPLSAFEALLNYDWPGNVRELQNVIERAVILTRDGILRLPAGGLKPSANPPAAKPLRKGNTLKDLERDYIVRALEEANWIVGGNKGAAVRLGLPRTTLVSKMRKLGIGRSRQGALMGAPEMAGAI